MKNSLTGVPSIAALFSAYASLSAFITLLQQAFNQFIPHRVRDYIIEKFEEWFNKSRSSPCLFTLVIEESDSDSEGYNNRNQVFEACEKYLSTKLSSSANRLKVSRHRAEDTLNFKLAQGEQFKESFEGKDIVWSYIISSDEHSRQQEKRHFEIVIEEKYKAVLKSYLNFVLDFYDEMMERKKDLNLYTLSTYFDWHSVEFKHPFTFNSLAMDPEVKKSIIDDLDRFVKRKDFYKRVGKAWKRGYLLYGPPGTGKSSLIAAMANYLKFDIYDLQLDRVENDSNLRHLMLNTSNKSILVLEDIDCSFGLPSCRDSKDDPSNSENKVGVELQTTSKISLSGLLNFVDGLWSSCGDERIIIFTTNDKDKLDPALLRPGRMDIHIHMSYLTMPGFRVLASNYLQTRLHDEQEDEHEYPLFGEIESLIEGANVTAAEISEEMLRSDDNIEAALGRVVQLLKMKKSKIKETKERLVTLHDNDMNLGVEKKGEFRKIEV